jgi:hypothetical protein
MVTIMSAQDSDQQFYLESMRARVMTEAIKEQKKHCPICKAQYTEKDNYCPNDGSPLEITEADHSAPMLSQ